MTLSLTKNILSQLMENKNRGRGSLLEGLEDLLKEKMKEMIKDVLEEVAYEEREMFFEEKRSRNKRGIVPGDKKDKTLHEEEQQRNTLNSDDDAITEQISEENSNHLSNKTANRKNGFYSRNLLTQIGEVELNIPRDRYGEFHPFFIDRYNRNLFTISEIVISMYQGGLSTRDITNTLNNLLGKKYSPYWVSRITDTLIEQINKWKSRKIEEYFPIIYMDGLYVKIRRAGIVDSESFVVAIGINEYGYREVLGFVESGGGESRENYKELIIHLRDRGLKEPLLFISDGLIGIEGVIKEIYPHAEFQSCMIHKMRHTLLKVRKRDRDAVSEALRHVIHQNTKEAFIDAFNAFQREWKKVYPYIVRSWKNSLDTLTTFFNYPEEIRRYIYTTNTVERFIKEVKRRTKVIEVFPQVNSAEKIMYLVSIDMNEKYASRRLRGFQNAHDALMKIREERYSRNKEVRKEKETKQETKTSTDTTTDKMGASAL